MDELILVMKELLEEVRRMNEKLDDLRGNGFNSIDDVCTKLDTVSSKIEDFGDTFRLSLIL